MNNKKKKIASFGFTLIEVLIATSIMAAGIVGVMGAYSLSNQSSFQSYCLSQAVSIGQNTLEMETAKPSDQLQPQKGQLGKYQWELTYSSKPNNLMQAVVLVSWLDKGQKQTYLLEKIFLPRS